MEVDRRKAVLFLRLGLGLTFSYSGYHLLADPVSWYWAIDSLPGFLRQIFEGFGVDMILRMQGAVELLMALVMLGWFLPIRVVRIASILGLLGAAAALFFLLRGDRAGV
jgi:hypothetical protein